MSTSDNFEWDDDSQTLEAEESAQVEKSSKMSGKKLAVIGGSAAGGLLLCGVAFIAGILIGGSGDSSGSSTPATSIRSTNSVLNQLESLKDSQIETLNDQLGRISVDQSKSNPDNLSGSNQNLVNYLAETKKDQAVIDGFLTDLMSLKPSASDNDVQIVVKAVQDKVDARLGASAIYELVNGNSAAKTLGAEGRKGSDSMFYLADINADTKTYVVVTPFVTNDKVTNQISIISIAQDRVAAYKFVGLIESESPDDFARSIADVVASVENTQ